ncbi:MAG: thioesterase family protein [Bacteroidota bacterium]
MQKLKELLKDFPVVVELPVQWGEMDAAKHVNNVVYLRWGESGRSVYFDKMGLDNSFTDPIGPILGWQDCKYIFSLTYPDTVLVGVKVSEIREDRFFMECHMFSQKYERIAAINKNAIVPYDYHNLKKVAIPKVWMERIESIEGFKF